jgi:serine/threonine protein kinase/Flp pilus assembly protein TadD
MEERRDMNRKVPKTFEFLEVQTFEPDKSAASDSPLAHSPEIGNPPQADDDSNPENDQVLADLVEELAAQLHSGGLVDWQACARDYPQYVEQLRMLLPALEALAATPASKVEDRKKLLFHPQAPILEAPSSTRTLGDFRLIREIGRGGMGVVYEAEQISLERRVALKILPFAAALDSRHLQRFKTEAQAAAQLHHTNIVPVYAVGCEQGTHYYAMQFIEGQTLAAVIRSRIEDRRSRIDRRKSPTEKSGTTVDGHAQPTRSSILNSRSSRIDSPRTDFRSIAMLGIQAAEALEYAHQMGVVHRDIKPANLLVDIRGNLWITDFGLARLSSWATPSGEAAQNMTGTGDLLGTLRYMSPEQAAGKRGTVDHRSDIYALGATLYECLTLQPAISGQTREEVLCQVAVLDPVSPRRIDKTIPIELETIVQKALAKRSEERYGTAQELADDLRRFLEDKPIRAKRPTLADKARKWARRHQALMRLAGIFALLAVAGLVVSLVFIARQRNEAEAQRNEAEVRRRQARRAADEMYTSFAESWLSRQPGMEALEKEFLLKALAFYEEFARENGSDLVAQPEIQFEAAKALRRIGDINYKLGRLAKAQDAFEQAVERIQKLSTEFPANDDFAEELALTHNNRGNVERDEGRVVQAHQSYREARRIFEILVRGIVLTGLGRINEAEQAYRRALTLLEESAANFPNLPTYRHDLAGCLNNLGNLLVSVSRFQEAEVFLRRALPIREKLAAGYPTFPAYRQGLASSHSNLGSLRVATARFAEAEAEYRLSLDIVEKLSTDFQAIPSYRQQKAACLLDLGRTMNAAGRLKDAQAAFTKSLTLQAQLSDDYPAIPEFRRELARGLDLLGSLLMKRGMKSEAAKTFIQVRQLRHKMTQDWSESPAGFQEFAWFLTTCPDQSFWEPKLALTMAERALALAPENGDCWSALGVAHYRTGEWKKADSALQKAIQLKNGGVCADWLFLAMTCWNLNDCQEAQRWFDQANAWLDHKSLISENWRASEMKPKPCAKLKIESPWQGEANNESSLHSNREIKTGLIGSTKSCKAPRVFCSLPGVVGRSMPAQCRAVHHLY